MRRSEVGRNIVHSDIVPGQTLSWAGEEESNVNPVNLDHQDEEGWVMAQLDLNLTGSTGGEMFYSDYGRSTQGWPYMDPTGGEFGSQGLLPLGMMGGNDTPTMGVASEETSDMNSGRSLNNMGSEDIKEEKRRKAVKKYRESGGGKSDVFEEWRKKKRARYKWSLEANRRERKMQNTKEFLEQICTNPQTGKFILPKRQGQS